MDRSTGADGALDGSAPTFWLSRPHHEVAGGALYEALQEAVGEAVRRPGDSETLAELERWVTAHARRARLVGRPVDVTVGEVRRLLVGAPGAAGRAELTARLLWRVVRWAAAERASDGAPERASEQASGQASERPAR